MNSKAIKRQLLAAIAMVLVAAIALGSSTYAWFVASGEVTANEMHVMAQAESGLLIRVHTGENNPNKFSSVASLGNEAESLYPVSTVDLENWYHNNSDSAIASKGGVWSSSNTNGTLYTKIAEENLPSYVLKTQFAIRSATNTAVEDVKLRISDVSVEGLSTTLDLNKSIRVGIKVSKGGAASNSGLYIYAPKADGTFNLNTVYKTGELTPAASQKAEPTAVGNADCLLLLNNTIPSTADGLIVDVYIWYEGEDDNCTTDHITGLTPDDLSVSVTFEQVADTFTGATETTT